MYQETTRKAFAERKRFVRSRVLSPSPNYYGVQCPMRLLHKGIRQRRLMWRLCPGLAQILPELHIFTLKQMQ